MLLKQQPTCVNANLLGLAMFVHLKIILRVKIVKFAMKNIANYVMKLAVNVIIKQIDINELFELFKKFKNKKIFQ